MKINFTETVLRDGNQSLIATRMPISEMRPILEKMDDAGYYSLECWGGATFDSCLRFLNEDPWERLRTFKSICKKTKLQMLLRGQNLLGYKHYPDDIVRLFVKKSIENGIDIIRLFDALNDFRNLETAMDEAKKNNAIVSGAICYTTSPIHTIESFAKMGKQLENMGADTIAIKDMAGVMSPKSAYDLVTELKRTVKKPIVVHTHATTGLGTMTLLKAVEAGAEIIDTSISSFSGGTSQPPTEAISYALKQFGYESSLDLKKLKEINDYFKPLFAEFIEDKTLDPYVLMANPDVLVYQVPGGMLSNLISQLKEQDAFDKLEEALEEIPRVRKDLGYPPLVTPMSQIVGVQSVLNVVFGERYKSVPKETKAYLMGEYGAAPGKIDKELAKKILGDEKPITERPANLLKPEYEKMKEECGEYAKNDEDILSYALFPQVAMNFFKEREETNSNKFKYKISQIG